MAYRKPLATPVGLATFFSLFAILAVGARFWARRKNRMKLQMDDWFLIPALLLCLANSIIMLIAATNGNLGKLMPLRPDGFPVVNPDFDTFQKCIYANKIVSTLAIACARHAILLFYNRIFIGRLFTFQVWALFILNGTWGVVYTFLYIFSCKPISDNWTSVAGAKGRHCLPVVTNTVYAVSSVLIDAFILSIPWPHVLRLKISKKEKAAVLGIFGLGALVLAVAIGKCVGFYTVADKIYKSHQVTREVALTMYWTIPECCMAVVCACLPTLRPLFRGWSPESVLGSMRSAISLHSTRLRMSDKSPKASGEHVDEVNVSARSMSDTEIRPTN